MFIELESGSHFNGTLHSEITELESLLKHLLDNIFFCLDHFIDLFDI